MNVLFRRGDQAFIDENIPLNDGQIIFNETDEAIYVDNTINGTVVRKRYGGGNLSRSDVDSALSTSSTNPIQNQAVATALNGKAPTSHASTATTYGVGTTTNYGHCMTINNLNTSAHANGKALSAYQGKVLNDKISKTEDLIAYVQTTLTASKAYAVGEQFVYNGLLYKVTVEIAQGGTITIDGNCELANSVTEQIKELTHTFTRGITNFPAGFSDTDIPYSVIPLNAKCVTPYFPSYDSGGITKIVMWVMRTGTGWRISAYSWNTNAISNTLAVDYIL